MAARAKSNSYFRGGAATGVGREEKAANMKKSKTMKFEKGGAVPILPPGLGNPDPRDHVPYKPPSDRPVRRSGTPS